MASVGVVVRLMGIEVGERMELAAWALRADSCLVVGTVREDQCTPCDWYGPGGLISIGVNGDGPGGSWN